jgi:hypothetical protein
MKPKKTVRNSIILGLLSLSVIVIYRLNSADEVTSSFHQVPFSSLPSEIQDFLLERRDSTVDKNSFRCYSLDDSCKCSLQSKNNLPWSKGVLSVSTCSVDHEVDFGSTALRLFLVKDQEIYFPIVETISYSTSTKIADEVELRDIKYGKITLVNKESASMGNRKQH